MPRRLGEGGHRFLGGPAVGAVEEGLDPVDLAAEFLNSRPGHGRWQELRTKIHVPILPGDTSRKWGQTSCPGGWLAGLLIPHTSTE